MNPPPRSGHYRWYICGLLFFATTINYVDRQVIGILKGTLQGEFGWSEIDYSNIVFAFQFAYAIGLLLAGRLMDRLGTKAGYALAIVVWSIAAMLHAEATVFGPWVSGLLGVLGLVTTPSVAGFIAARFALGLGEAGNFPAAIKATAEWFPKKERAFATGIFNSGTNVGALLTPLVVPWITLTWGWYWAFVITGLLGFLWLVVWWATYDNPETHKSLSAAELAYIRSDPAEAVTPIPWSRVVRFREAWAFAIGKFMTDPIWWLYLFWIPDFLQRNHGLDLKSLGLPIVVIYLIADVGSIGSNNIMSWKLAGAVGVVTDATARDTDEIITEEVPLYLRRPGRGIRPWRNEVESVNRPVVVGGVLVNPGDVIVADGDGVLVVLEEVDARAHGPPPVSCPREGGARRARHRCVRATRGCRWRVSRSRRRTSRRSWSRRLR